MTSKQDENTGRRGVQMNFIQKIILKTFLIGKLNAKKKEY